uniref:Uncharacterized protein n=1 Tax=Oryza punctata TaxID=4537 RepID=A0A0E0KBA7_ORYPU
MAYDTTITCKRRQLVTPSGIPASSGDSEGESERSGTTGRGRPCELCHSAGQVSAVREHSGVPASACLVLHDFAGGRLPADARFHRTTPTLYTASRVGRTPARAAERTCTRATPGGSSLRANTETRRAVPCHAMRLPTLVIRADRGRARGGVTQTVQ